MDKVESCQPVSSQNQFPSFSKSSCTGTRSAESVAEERSCSKDQVNLTRPFEGKDHFEGWAKSLEFFPGVTSASINDKPVEYACSMKGNSSVRTSRNKKLGYRLWKEGYVKNVLTKPNVKQHIIKFLVKARVHASMKNTFYSVCVHLDQETGEIVCLCLFQIILQYLIHAIVSLTE